MYSKTVSTVISKKRFTRFPSIAFTYCAHLLFYLAGGIKKKYKRKPCKYFLGTDCTFKKISLLMVSYAVNLVLTGRYFTRVNF